MSNATPNLGIPHIATNQSQKEVTANTAFDDLDLAMTANVAISVSGSADVTPAPSTLMQGFSFELTGTLTGNIHLIVPATPKFYRIYHNASSPSIGDYTVIVKVAGHTGVVVNPQQTRLLYCNGVDVFAGDSSTGGGSSALSTLSDVSVTAPANGDLLQYNSGTGKWQNAVSATITPFQSRQKEVILNFYYNGDPSGLGNYPGPFISGDTNYVSGAPAMGATLATNTNRGAASNLVSSGTGAAGFAYGDNQYVVGRNLKILGKIWLSRITDTRFKWGLNGNPLVDSDTTVDDLAGFRFSTIAGDTHYKCVTGDATTLTVTDSGITPVANVERTFAIIFDDVSPNVKFYIDGTLVATNTTHLPRTGQALAYSLGIRGNSSVNNVSIGYGVVACDY